MGILFNSGTVNIQPVVFKRDNPLRRSFRVPKLGEIENGVLGTVY